MNADDPQHVVRFDPIIVRGRVEPDWQDAEVDQILPVDAREALVDEQAQPEVSRRVLATRLLAVVLAADRVMASLVADAARPPDVCVVDPSNANVLILGEGGCETAGRDRWPA